MLNHIFGIKITSRIPVRGFKPLDPLPNTIFAIGLGPCGHDFFNRDVGVCSVIRDIFHELLFFDIKGVKDRISTAVKFQRDNFVLSAKLDIKCRRCFAPFAVQVEFSKTVISEQVRS